MTKEMIYGLLLLVVLIILAVVFYVLKKQKLNSQIRPLTLLAFFLVFFGLFLNSQPTLCYIFIGVGILLSLCDIINRYRHPNKDEDSDNNQGVE